MLGMAYLSSRKTCPISRLVDLGDVDIGYPLSEFSKPRERTLELSPVPTIDDTNRWFIVPGPGFQANQCQPRLYSGTRVDRAVSIKVYSPEQNKVAGGLEKRPYHLTEFMKTKIAVCGSNIPNKHQHQHQSPTSNIDDPSPHLDDRGYKT
jgi:hypothetical protein